MGVDLRAREKVAGDVFAAYHARFVSCHQQQKASYEVSAFYQTPQTAVNKLVLHQLRHVHHHRSDNKTTDDVILPADAGSMVGMGPVP